MSPTSLGAISLATPSIPGPPHIPDNWVNPAPKNWKRLDDRRHYLQAISPPLFLEMHPNATRGVSQYTKYCVLNIFILNLTHAGSDGLKFGWDSDSKNANSRKNWNSNTTPLHIIQSHSTGRFLCMDNNSALYQSNNISYDQCVFRHEYKSQFIDRYYRQINDSVKWYLGMNKDGSMLCGNKTIRRTKRIDFTKGIYKHGEHPVMIDPSPVDRRQAKTPCCTKKNCRKNKKRRSKCRKKWCRNYRRKFFKLSLKELRKYFKHCVQNIRHCKNKKKTKAVDR